MKYQLNLGCDPEFFIGYTDNKDVAYDPTFIPGGNFALPPIVLEDEFHVIPLSLKDWKHPLYIDVPNGDGLHTKFVGDGAAIELNFNRPFTSPDELFEAVQHGKVILKDWLRDIGFGINDSCVTNFDYKRYWESLTTKDPRHEMSVIFGCDPDKDAHNLKWSCQITDVKTHPYRYGGGHIHISGDSEIGENPIPFVKLLSLTAGNYCITQAHEPELERLRAKYYGKPGKYRVQNYPDGSVGVEYRTPSNQWTNWSKKSLTQLFDWIEVALDLLHNPRQGILAIEEFTDATVEAVGKVNSELSQAVLDQL
jgi:hypothetical protein